jgi:hypothetical protein
MIQKFVRMLLLLGMVAVMCGTVSAAGMGIVAETQETSSLGGYPVCTSPCECISETVAMQRWGANGYDFCSKTVCGQSSDAMVQYYCIHQVGSTVAASTVTCTAPYECLSETTAAAKWGVNGYTQGIKTSCGNEVTTGGSVPRYCYKQWVSTVNVAPDTTAPAAGTRVPVNVPTQVQTQALGTPSLSTTLATPYPIQTKSPLNSTTILAAIGVALLAASGMKRK